MVSYSIPSLLRKTTPLERLSATFLGIPSNGCYSFGIKFTISSFIVIRISVEKITSGVFSGASSKVFNSSDWYFWLPMLCPRSKRSLLFIKRH